MIGRNPGRMPFLGADSFFLSQVMFILIHMYSFCHNSLSNILMINV